MSVKKTGEDKEVPSAIRRCNRATSDHIYRVEHPGGEETRRAMEPGDKVGKGGRVMPASAKGREPAKLSREFLERRGNVLIVKNKPEQSWVTR